ncbi:hypothetical protein SOK14_004228 [Cronobacter turicensis]|nr:hypothetical protein [Cronobacter turicensis]
MMARYRVGNKFLSQAEFDEEQDAKWIGGLFLVGALLTGFLLHHYLVNPEWHKAIRIAVTVIPALGMGILLAFLHRIVRMLMGLAFILAILALVIKILVSLI